MATSIQEEQGIPQTIDPAIAEGKFFAAVGYFSILCFVPLFLKRDNKFAQFHGRQGLVLFILEIATAMLVVIPVVGEIIFRLSWVVFGIFSLAGVVKVLMNQYWEMPVIYPISSKITL